MRSTTLFLTLLLAFAACGAIVEGRKMLQGGLSDYASLLSSYSSLTEGTAEGSYESLVTALASRGSDSEDTEGLLAALAGATEEDKEADTEEITKLLKEKKDDDKEEKEESTSELLKKIATSGADTPADVFAQLALKADDDDDEETIISKLMKDKEFDPVTEDLTAKLAAIKTAKAVSVVKTIKATKEAEEAKEALLLAKKVALMKAAKAAIMAKKVALLKAIKVVITKKVAAIKAAKEAELEKKITMVKAILAKKAMLAKFKAEKDAAEAKVVPVLLDVVAKGEEKKADVLKLMGLLSGETVQSFAVLKKVADEKKADEVAIAGTAAALGLPEKLAKKVVIEKMIMIAKVAFEKLTDGKFTPGLDVPSMVSEGLVSNLANLANLA